MVSGGELMTVEEMIKEALAHTHTPVGWIRWQIIGDDSQQFSRCKCGIELTRKTAPIDAGHNWEDWGVN